MLLRRLLAALFILFTATASRWKDDSVGEKSSEIIGRFFPILPPYHGVDFGANFNKLKSTGDAAYFVVRDSIVVKLLYPHDGRFTIFGKSSIMAPWYICTGSSECFLLVLKSEYNTNQKTPDTSTYMIFFNLFLQFVGVNLMWAMIHLLMWDGKAASNADILQSVLSPGETLIIITLMIRTMVRMMMTATL